MAEYTNVSVQTVTAGSNVLFTETPICGCDCIRHRAGSGIITLRGGKRYKISFHGNIAVPTGGTAGAISIAIAIAGEQLASTVATVTPAAVSNYFNVSAEAIIDVPCDCCIEVAIKNVSPQAINVANANIIVTGA